MTNLLLIIGVILFVLWVLGFVTSYTLGGYVHIALIIAVILFVAWAIMKFARRR
jgi:hypothetical protein